MSRRFLRAAVHAHEGKAQQTGVSDLVMATHTRAPIRSNLPVTWSSFENVSGSSWLPYPAE
jgi:hypothetical protein